VPWLQQKFSLPHPIIKAMSLKSNLRAPVAGRASRLPGAEPAHLSAAGARPPAGEAPAPLPAFAGTLGGSLVMPREAARELGGHPAGPEFPSRRNHHPQPNPTMTEKTTKTRETANVPEHDRKVETHTEETRRQPETKVETKTESTDKQPE
jgi:hypothetical protein